MSASPVDFLVIGGAKCATTWLQRSLMQSTGIAMPHPELHFFSREFARGPTWYAEQLPDPEEGVLVGEKSNSYLTEPAAAGRIRDCLPDVKMIVQMRDPVERAYSDYCMLYRRGTVDGDVRAHLDPARAANARFIRDGRYALHLRRFLDLFPRDRFLFLLYEEVTGDPSRHLGQLAGHIGYDGALAPPVRGKAKDKTAAHVPASLRRVLKPLRPLLDPVRGTWPISALRNAVAKPFAYPPLPPDLRSALETFYRPDIEDLGVLTGLDLSRWGTRSGVAAQ